MPYRDEPFSFEISLSVLNHLGRNLYRSFATVLGEAISNSWDANAKNVWIYIDREKNSLLVKDDGDGMSKDDFQNKFLKIGYSKRKDGSNTSPKGRPYIGRKGIGKLALLSCADKITVISKTADADYIGGVIDNSELDKAITEDLTPQQYPLKEWDTKIFEQYLEKHEHGTIIYFEEVKDGIRNSLEYLKKTIALYFRFSLIDDSFNIFIDDEKITNDHLNDLAKNTEFLWNINGLKDPFIEEKLNNVKENKPLSFNKEIKGFIASVSKPADLKIITTSEKASVDLFVNGRLREKDILRHMPTARIAENYLYGQIHFNTLDDEVDRFTSSRESVVADDPKYKAFLDSFRSDVIGTILQDWDIWRRKYKKDGDPENKDVPTKQRKAEELFNAVSEEYDLPEAIASKKVVDAWVDSLGDDAKYNFVSYAECFISENLIRKFIIEKSIALSPQAQRDIDEWKKKEAQNKSNGNISIDIRKNDDALSYLDMSGLANLVDKVNTQDCLPNDSKEYRPIRDALMHTALLSDEAKRKLTTVYDNIRARLRKLLSENN